MTICIPTWLLGQEVIPEVEINIDGPIPRPLCELPVYIELDSLQSRPGLDINQTELLDRSLSSVYIRSYGPGLASTLSRHGFSPSQSTVYWHGVPLNSPALGLTDLSTLPNDGQLLLDNGAGGVLYGSGYMGGGVHLLNDVPDTGFTWKVNTNYRTSRLWGNSVELANRGKSSFHQVAFHATNGDQAYEYTDIYGNELTRLGAQQEQYHFRYSGGYFGTQQRLTWGLWGSQLDRGIPRSISESYTEGATQWDQVARAFVKYGYSSGSLDINAQIGGYAEDQRYYSTVLNDTNVASAVYSQVEATYEFNQRLGLITSIDHAYMYVEGSSKSSSSINRVGAAIHGYYQFTENLYLNAGVRQERQLVSTPIIPVVNLQWRAGPWDAKVQYRSHYRFPTLNDLFWSPGGNPDLLPELGNTLDIHVGWKKLGDDYQLRIGASAFRAQITNYILWVPSGAFFEPRNVKEVQNIGSTFKIDVSKDVQGWIVGVRGNYSWTRARTVESQRSNDPSLNNQLIYTPEHKSTLGLYSSHGNWEFGASNRVYGRVHTTTDNQKESSIDPFQVWDLNMSYFMNYNRYKITLDAGIRNLFDTDYSFQRFYPMPGIQAVFSLTIQFAQHET